MIFPRLIAICGYPGAGKSEVQRILEERYGVQPVDDGAPLREIAVKYFGLSWDDVRTQEGKRRSTGILNKNWVNRKLLGELGNSLEALLGAHIMPFMATRRLAANHSYSFGSVRRDQGRFYKEMDGIVVGVRRPGVGPSGNEFDQFDESLVDYWIENDGDLQKLSDHVDHLIAWAKAELAKAA